MLKSKRIDVKDSLRLRVATLKIGFKKGFDYTTLYQYEFGTQSFEQLHKIRMVWNLREVDEVITVNLERLSKKLLKNTAA